MLMFRRKTDKLNKIKVVDYSDDAGFVFGFVCANCGYEWRSERQPFKTLEYDADETERKLHWVAEKRKAYDLAKQDAAIEFNKCPECESWVCDDCFYVTDEDFTDFCIECVEDMKE